MISLDFNGLSWADRTGEEIREEIAAATAVVCHVRLQDNFGPWTYSVTVFYDTADRINVASLNEQNDIGGVTWAPDAKTALETVAAMLVPNRGSLLPLTPEDVPRVKSPEEKRAERRERWLRRTAFENYKIQASLRSGELEQSAQGALSLWTNYAELREVTRGE